ncbi:hypothetical protein PR202_gb27962 [Eleusine coracana subsp. coracana]|uniref:BZIP domain-containing protein n=1 Tax=Eleusine coracana subsp. coracana TaxID=191504 RepID=A0AAV5FVK0_ELECO|nr:hypothetical protein PR202_gb27962 [Eleusine coracana subsp. coracana]
MAALAFHSIGAADFASCFLLPHGTLVHEHYTAGGDAVPWLSYAGGCHDAGDGEQGGGARDQRKERRLASNRESARRSRVRRRRQLDELASRVAELRGANARLAVELNRVLAAHARVVRESARLRDEQRDLRERLAAAEATAASSTAKEPGDDDVDEAGTPPTDD